MPIVQFFAFFVQLLFGNRMDAGLRANAIQTITVTGLWAWRTTFSLTLPSRSD